MNLNVNTQHSCEIDYDENDDIVYKRIYMRCKSVFKQLVSSMEEESADLSKTSHFKNGEHEHESEQDIDELERKL